LDSKEATIYMSATTGAFNFTHFSHTVTGWLMIRLLETLKQT
jgi:hypothetical protein